MKLYRKTHGRSSYVMEDYPLCVEIIPGKQQWHIRVFLPSTACVYPSTKRGKFIKKEGRYAYENILYLHETWLPRHGFTTMTFPTRRQALDAFQLALEMDPLPEDTNPGLD